MEHDHHLNGDMSHETFACIDEYMQELEQLRATDKGSVSVAAGCLSDGQEGALGDNTSVMQISFNQLSEAQNWCEIRVGFRNGEAIRSC